jgi:hypothetical protein
MPEWPDLASRLQTEHAFHGGTTKAAAWRLSVFGRDVAHLLPVSVAQVLVATRENQNRRRKQYDGHENARFGRNTEVFARELAVLGTSVSLFGCIAALHWNELIAASAH